MRTYKQLADKMKTAGDRIRKSASADQLVVQATDNYRRELDSDIVRQAATAAGFQEEWLSVLAKKGKKQQASTQKDVSWLSTRLAVAVNQCYCRCSGCAPRELPPKPPQAVGVTYRGPCRQTCPFRCPLVCFSRWCSGAAPPPTPRVVGDHFRGFPRVAPQVFGGSNCTGVTCVHDFPQ